MSRHRGRTGGMQLAEKNQKGPNPAKICSTVVYVHVNLNRAESSKNEVCADR